MGNTTIADSLIMGTGITPNLTMVLLSKVRVLPIANLVPRV